MGARAVWLWALVALVLVLTIFLALAPSAHATFPGANGRIAVVRSPPTNVASDIQTMNPDGSALTDLTSEPGGEDSPSWSPDGTKIVFVSNRDGNNEIYSMQADGSSQTRLTNDPSADGQSAWSADGQRIVFLSNRSGSSALHSMNADGTGVQAIPNTEGGFTPAWSPDGSKIAFVSCGSYYCDVFTINPDGTGKQDVSNNAGPPQHSDLNPNWSPDGTRIAFDRDDYQWSGCDYAPFPGCADIWVMNADGTRQVRLTTDSVGDFPPFTATDPAWSPDGTKIAFISNKVDYQYWELFTINPDGSGRTQVTHASSSTDANFHPDWQPVPVAAYPHPLSASQLSVSIVPAFRQCATSGNPSNAKHSPPLATNSCNPPRPGSVLAAVGVSSQSSAQMTVVAGDSDPTNGNQANVSITAALSDIQSTAGGDYNPNPSSADLTAVTRLRFTDKASGSGDLPATATEYDFRVPIDCSSTSNPLVGSSCSANTTANALVPGLVREQRRTIVQAFRVRVDDSGANGTRGDNDDRIFMTQGVFVP